MTNIEAIRSFDEEQFAVFLKFSCYNSHGWEKEDLVEWLKAPDNITDEVDKRLQYENKMHFGGL